MKKLLLVFACSLSLFASAQNNVNITSHQYDVLKQNHLLNPSANYVFTDITPPGNPIHYQNSGMRSASSICSCMVPLDSTFIVAPFTNGTPPDYRNDDGSTPLIALPFNFNLYGTTYNSLYINNNGNVSFGSSFYTFSAVGFPSTNFIMSAPFWADVDTRNSGSGLVYYKITPTHIIVKWDNVGYFASMADKLNSFQLILTDGNDTILPSGKNSAFCYGDMQWTTGAASQGINGFGGIAATVGVNKGDGISYFQVGRFDSAGVAFDGPYNTNDKVDWLDNIGVYFNTTSSSNIPPVIINNNICDTIDVFTGDTTHTMIIDSVQFTLGAATPESGQTVTTTITSPDAANLSYVMTTNTPEYKEYACSFKVMGIAPGLHFVTITATDNGLPVETTSKTIVIRSHYDQSLATTTSISENNNSSFISIYPNPAETNIIIKHSFGSNSVFTLTNVIGQNVLLTVLNNQELTIDISKLEMGIYFATIKGKEGKSKTIKVVRK